MKPLEEANGVGLTEEKRSEAQSSEDTGQWYVLHVLSAHEARVKKSIERRIQTEEMGDLIGQVVIPVERVSEIRRGKRVQMDRKIYPGYVFVRMRLRDAKDKLIEKTWHFIRETPGVIGFAGGENPLPMPPEQVGEILRQMEEGKERPSPKTSFAVGDRVKVGDGPFLNSEGVVEGVDLERGKLWISVNMFGRSTPVELEFWQVEKAT
ncbi:Transcription termination/antitermination protein NusG [Methylacidimicrobium cyclopophantes]|uniref:Transcription termination/antitermination protein NusG n=1 Tax=Methylacidimicrobium cyclopophantes TaxID=1041766 RepID=A0A5E6MCQ2_9BACT|nr:transcription termination/antitermination protein NusG [Methylacidimicrobium cyclopophantes]VVM07219.1 Transcription termination/antitermination protein NusG [Methylacidimicrobium cyclopophantes]